MTDDNPIRPNGVDITVNYAGKIVLKFDHKDTPPIALSLEGAKQVGSELASAGNRPRHYNEENNDD